MIKLTDSLAQLGDVFVQQYRQSEPRKRKNRRVGERPGNERDESIQHHP